MEEFKNEIWSVIPEFETYEISNYGRIFSHRTRKFLDPHVNSEGALNVGLYRGRERVNHYVHRLVAQVFIPNFMKAAKVVHRDGNKSNNHVDNLKVISAVQMDRRRELENALSKAKKVRVVEWDSVYPSVPYLAEQLGTDNSNIYKVLRGQRESHLGLTFEYVS